jgi:hypothetical protein
MRVHVALAVLAFAAARAHAEPIAPIEIDDGNGPTADGGAAYLATGVESIVLPTAGTQRSASDRRIAAALDAGLRLGASAVYAHAHADLATSSYVAAAAGLELRVGGMVKGIFGLDAGYQHDARDVDRMVAATGPMIAPRLGVEVGTQKLWMRGTLDWRYTLAAHPSSSNALSLTVGHDF